MGFFTTSAATNSHTPTVEKRGRYLQSENGLTYLFNPHGQSNIYVNEETALKLSAVFLAVRVIAETMGVLPISLFKEKKGARGREKASDEAVHKLLHRRPNLFQTPMQFKEMLTAHAVLRGLGIARKIFDTAGRITQLIPLHPDKVDIGMRQNGEMYFKVTHTFNIDGQKIKKEEILFQSEVFFLFGMSIGFRPVSAIEFHAQSIGVSLSTREYKTSFFNNAVMPSGILKHPGYFADDAEKEIQHIRSEFKEQFSGGNRYSTMVLQHGMEWQQLGLTNKDAELIESEKFNIVDIARCFRIPPHKLMQIENPGQGNLEHMTGECITDCWLPWGTRFEEAAGRDLLTEKQKDENYYFKFNFDGLLRGDTESRTKYYASGRQWGYLSANDIREKEELPMLPKEIGEIYLSPVNMLDAKNVKDIVPTAPKLDKKLTSKESGNRAALAKIINTQVTKIIDRREKNYEHQLRKNENVTEWFTDFATKENEVARRMLKEVIEPIAVDYAGKPITVTEEAIDAILISLQNKEARTEIPNTIIKLLEYENGTTY